jgi:hypothetical protein
VPGSFLGVPVVSEHSRKHFLGTSGVALIQNGRPVGFLSAPVSRDADGRPVYTTWRLDSSTNTVDIKVYEAGKKHPVIVDPQWFVGSWWVGAALGAAGCFAVPGWIGLRQPPARQRRTPNAHCSPRWTGQWRLASRGINGSGTRPSPV